jgi:hypothetical protein
METEFLSNAEFWLRLAGEIGWMVVAVVLVRIAVDYVLFR